MSNWKSPSSRLAFTPPADQMPGFIRRLAHAPGDQRRRDRVRLVVPAADRVIEVVVALQRHAAPADLVVRYVITHDNSRHRRIELPIDAAEVAQEHLEYVLEYYHVTPAFCRRLVVRGRRGPACGEDAASGRRGCPG